MYPELMNENVLIRAENIRLRKVLFTLIAQADKDPFMGIGYFVEHGRASSEIAEVRAFINERGRQMVQFTEEQMTRSQRKKSMKGTKVKKAKPLDDLEMHDLLRLIYPEHICDDGDAYFELSSSIRDECVVDLGDDFVVPLADLLGRVVMLAMPMQSSISGRMAHCLGEVTVTDGKATMVAAVRRDCGQV